MIARFRAKHPRAFWIAVGFIVANEIRGIIVVAMVLMGGVGAWLLSVVSRLM